MSSRAPGVAGTIFGNGTSSSSSAAPAAPVETDDDQGSFQAAVLERLRAMCGEHEDAEVLAEFVVVMVAGNKGKEEMATELLPLFPDQAQAEAFTEWVEECKWKFLTGMTSRPVGAATSPVLGAQPTLHALGGVRSPKLVFSGAPGAMVPKRPALGVLPAIGPTAGAFCAAPASVAPPPMALPPPARPRLVPNAEFRIGDGAAAAAGAAAATSPAAPPTSPPAPPVRPGPFVAVTSRVVLQPNPSFATSQQREGAAAVAKSACAAQKAKREAAVAALAAQSAATALAVAAAPAPPQKPTPVIAIAAPVAASGAAGVSKNELLEKLTKQLQVILTKLNDKSLNDQTREKYQALAQNIQLQMAKISRPQAARRSRM